MDYEEGGVGDQGTVADPACFNALKRACSLAGL